MRARQQRRGLAKFSLPVISDETLQRAERAAGLGSSTEADYGAEGGHDEAPPDPGAAGGTAEATEDGGADRADGSDGIPGTTGPDGLARLPDTALPDIMNRPGGPVAPPDAAIGGEPAQDPPPSPQIGIGGMMLTSPILGEEMAIEEEQDTMRQADGPPRDQAPESEFVGPGAVPGRPRTGCLGSIDRWHPSPSFDACTNSASYPSRWDDNPSLPLVHDTVDKCCEATFGEGGECVVDNVCETVDMTYEGGFGPDDGPAARTQLWSEAEGAAPEGEESPVVMDTPAVVKEATSEPLSMYEGADRSAFPEEQSGEVQLEGGSDGEPVETDAEPSIDAPLESDIALGRTVEEEAAEVESEIAEALAGGDVDEVAAEELEAEIQRAVEDKDLDGIEDVEEVLELIEEEEEAEPEGLDDGFEFDGPGDEVFPAHLDVFVAEKGEEGYVPPSEAVDEAPYEAKVAAQDEAHVEAHEEAKDEIHHEDVRTGFPEEPVDAAPSERARPPAPGPGPSDLDGVDGLRDVPYEGDGYAFQLLRPKRVASGGGGASPLPLAAAGGLAALALLACYVRGRRRAPRRTLEYSALGTDDWGGTFSDDISFGGRYSDDEDGHVSLGSYGSDEECGNGTVLELGSIHETEANGGLCLREVNG